jgi:hypothetical protein
VRGGMAVPFLYARVLRAAPSLLRKSVMRPRRFGLRLYVRAARSILWVLDRLSDWEVNRMYPKT